MESAREFTAKELASAEERFEGGEDDYSAVLESQGALWAIDLELSEAQRSLRVHAVSLMKAVGGAPVRVDAPLIENGV
jgi:outer membrane protein TolC